MDAGAILVKTEMVREEQHMAILAEKDDLENNQTKIISVCAQ